MSQLNLFFSRSLCLLATFLIVAPPLSRAQETKPNLTGTWKLNLAKSRLASVHPREADSYDIKHQEPKLAIIHHFGGRTERFSYVTDGKDHAASVGDDGTADAKTVWDGATLVIEKQQQVPGSIARSTSRYTLSQDGKTLLITHEVKKSEFGGPFGEWLVYDKK